MKPTLRYEKSLWNKGLKLVAGVDEVGRGALAGPVIVAAVIFPRTARATPSVAKRKGNTLAEIRDSKLISAKKRERLATIIKTKSWDWAYGSASVAEINRLGIVKATQMAMRRAIQKLRKVDFVLVDAFYIPYLRGLRLHKQLAIKNGDLHCFSIAAASILAKVHRDNLMIKLGQKNPRYLLERHKGYGTLLHRQAIIKHGPKRFHRKLFIRKYI